MSGEERRYRVVFVTGTTTTHKEVGTINEARAEAAKAIRVGPASSVGVEEWDGKGWKLSEVTKDRI